MCLARRDPSRCVQLNASRRETYSWMHLRRSVHGCIFQFRYVWPFAQELPTKMYSKCETYSSLLNVMYINRKSLVSMFSFWISRKIACSQLRLFVDCEQLVAMIIPLYTARVLGSQVLAATGLDPQLVVVIGIDSCNQKITCVCKLKRTKEIGTKKQCF